MANIQSVRYDVPDNTPPAWLQGALGGLTGAMGARQQQQADMMKLLPVFAQMRMLKQGGMPGQPGVVNTPFGPVTLTSPGIDYSENLARLRGQELGYELDPTTAPEAYTKSQKERRIDSVLAADDSYRRMALKDPEQAAAIRESLIKLATGNVPTAPAKVNNNTAILPQNWLEAGAMSRFGSALTPWATRTEKALGPMTWGKWKGLGKKDRSTWKQKDGYWYEPIGQGKWQRRDKVK